MLQAKTFKQIPGLASEKAFEAHMKLYSGYVSKFNEISGALSENGRALAPAANAVYSPIRELKKEQTFALDGAILHEEYFSGLAAAPERTAPGPKLGELFDSFFGGYKNWLADFKASALSARGWVLTAWDQRSRSLMNLLQDAHDQGPAILAWPVITLDMYEHAYFMDFGADKAAYIDAFLAKLDWARAERKAEAIPAS